MYSDCVQVYIPFVNYALYALCLVVICIFQTSDRLGAAYGADMTSHL
jgi:K+ transporter